MTNMTIYRKDYQPYPFELHSVDLDFKLFDDHAVVKNTMVLERTFPGALFLYGDGLQLTEMFLDNEPLQEEAYELQGQNLVLRDCPEGQFTLKIITRIFPQENTALSGLYRTQSMFCTQCEAEGFRRITFFPDRPDVLSIYTTRIEADKKNFPILLSNGNLIDSGDADGGRHWATWNDPFKKPSYLFALVAGNLACVKDTFTTCSGRDIDLRIYVEPGNEDRCQHAMDSLKKAMRWDEEVYGLEYDLDIFMIVAVSDFNMGAMENKGLNIFNSKYILARKDTATDQDYEDIEGVVAHEYFHNWTGNRVTCRDWFQLSLKEGLTVFRDQEFSRDMNSREVNRIKDVRVLRNTQFPEDAGAMAHPVRPDSYQEINNFYTATVYNKGAEVIRMQHTLLGAAGFRRGMDLYFKRHDGFAVTIDDFVTAMEDANAVDLFQFKRWYHQAGTPVVDVQSDYQNGVLSLHFSQTCRSTPECKDKKPFHIPIKVGLFTSKGEQISAEPELIQLKGSKETIQFENIPQEPVVSLLQDFSAPVMINYEQTEDALSALLRFESNGFAKWDAAMRLTTECIRRLYTQDDDLWHIPSSLLEDYAHVLQDESLEASLKAELFMPPGFEDIAGRLNQIDVGQLEMARDFYRQYKGQYLFDMAKDIYQNLWQKEEHLMNQEAFGHRKLRNVCLWLMMKGNEADALPMCLEQFKRSETMTDQIAAFNLLVNCHDESARREAIDSFYQQWQSDELVMDKWFTAQALCELPGTLEQVQSLMRHPAFNFKNPNKVRALIGTFCFGNHRHFHALDGSGYGFLSDMLLAMDKYNPQVSARLATPFTRWQRLDKARQDLMKEQLKLIAAEDLSRDLRELVSKSIEAK